MTDAKKNSFWKDSEMTEQELHEQACKYADQVFTVQGSDDYDDHVQAYKDGFTAALLRYAENKRGLDVAISTLKILKHINPMTIDPNSWKPIIEEAFKEIGNIPLAGK